MRAHSAQPGAVAANVHDAVSDAEQEELALEVEPA